MLTPADYANHIDKWAFTVPFVCGATNLGEALRRITEGAAMIRSKGEAGTGDVSNAVTHMRTIRAEHPPAPGHGEGRAVRRRQGAAGAVRPRQEVAEAGKLPVVLFTAGGIATPADAAMMMQLGAEGVFVGSGIFKSGNPAQRAEAIVKATTFFDDPDVVAKVSRGLGEAMVGINVDDDPAAAPARRARLVADARDAVTPPSACSRSRGTCASTCAMLERGRRRHACRTPAGRARRGRRHRRCPAASRPRWPSWPGPSSCSTRCGPRLAGGLPAFGTCAGMILLADRDRGRRRRPGDASAGSTSWSGATPSAARSTRSRPTWTSPALDERPFHAMFIRAPWVEKVGTDVDVVATVASGRGDG